VQVTSPGPATFDIRTVAITGSTNADLAALARDGAREGIWLRADQQLAGRGRQGRAWQSPPGNLYASTLVRLRPEDPAAATLALVAAVALHHAVRSALPRHQETHGAAAGALMIKWPNDLLVGNAKLAGILLERQDDAVIIGFGVNLAHHPQLPDRPTTSLEAIAGSAPGAHGFVRVLAAIFGEWLSRWRREGLEVVRAAWLEAAHPVGTRLVAGSMQGHFDGLEESGALRLRLGDGLVHIVNAGDVFLV
jgi:BirA family biotin operon repressor/biotin-[acetyl-CoA-carboxylase] ligase